MRHVPGIAIRPVRNGHGIVATRRIAVGALVCRIGGRIVDPAQLWRWWETDPQRAANCLRFDADRYLDPGRGPGAFLNHSCSPNTLIERSGRFLVIRATRVIRPGSEVTNDYSTLIGPDDVWTMRCNCGERNCRGKVVRVDRLPLQTQRRYRRIGAIPAFILGLMPSPCAGRIQP